MIRFLNVNKYKSFNGKEKKCYFCGIPMEKGDYYLKVILIDVVWEKYNKLITCCIRCAAHECDSLDAVRINRQLSLT